MRTLWYKLEGELETSIVFILDASDSGQPYWEEILNFVYKLFDFFPKSVQIKIYFLGNPSPYTFAEIRENYAAILEKNKGRASLITPIFEQLESEDISTIVVLAAGRIFDLEDWQHTQLLEKALFVNFGNQTITSEICEEWLPSIDHLKSKLYNPIQKVELSGKGIMPIYWDNPAYYLQGTSLIAEHAKSYAVHVGFLSAGTQEPEVVATLEDGTKRILKLKKSNEASSLEQWRRLSDNESKIVGQCLTEGSYRCPVCQNEHKASQLKCKKDRRKQMGTTIFNSFENTHGFVLLRVNSEYIDYWCQPTIVLQITANEVAVKDGEYPIAYIYRFNPDSGEWYNTGKQMQQYTPIGENIYAIIL